MTLDQSIPLSMLFSAAGGVLNVFAVASLAHPESQRKKGVEWSKPAQIGALVLNLMFQGISALANIAGTWFGPVSVVMPTILGSQLLFSMFMFGLLMRLEKFPKETRVGTYLVVIAVAFLPIVGPEAQEGQDILHLLSQPSAATWSALLLAATIVSAIGLFFIAKRVGEGRMEKKTTISFICNLVAQTAGGVLGLTLSKAFVLVRGPALIVALLLAGITAAIQAYGVVLQSTTVNQSTFMPVLATANIVANALTGIVVWEDLATVQSGVGYVCTFILMILGIYLLSDLDLCASHDTDSMNGSTIDDDAESASNSLQVSPLDVESLVVIDDGNQSMGDESSADTDEQPIGVEIHEVNDQ